MAEMNLKQITDKLNTEFSGKNRKLVFWYDDNGDFEAEIDGLELNGAKVYHLETDNQFQTKYFFERVDTTKSYLIYAPFPRPSVRDNHLEDTIRYSKVFYADRASLLMVDLGIDKKYKAVIQKHIKFFAARDRRQRFYDLEIQNFNKESIEVALMSCLCKTHTASFEEVVRVVLMETENSFESNRILEEFQKYDLLEIFWDFCRQQFGYTEQSPSLEKLVLTLFLTTAQRSLGGALPSNLKPFISDKTGNIIAFMDSLMNNILTLEKYNALSDYVARKLDMENVLSGFEPADLIDCDTFAIVDQRLIDWLIERLLAEDTGAKLGDLTLPEICRERLKKHFSKEFTTSYKLLNHAYYLIINANYQCKNNFKALVDQYLKVDFEMDGHYRKFFYYFDQLGDTAGFEKLASLVENIYSNEYLDKIVRGWNETFDIEEVKTTLPLQRRFYKRIIEPNKDKLVVIISDALRYEVGHELFLKLQVDERCTASFSGMLGLIPSTTRLGMAALLPHHSLSVSDDYKVLVDGKNADDLKQRETILKSYVLSSRCVQFDDIRNMKKAELREVFTGQEVVYIYHNQIDARGDKANTENEVFTACQEAVEEIDGLIRRLSGSANTYHFMVTADHGFIYKRDKLQESDKLSNNAEKDAFVNRRFIIHSNPLIGDGIVSRSLGEILGNDDSKSVTTPISANVFKVSGGGQNYVHGGSSPQEMIVPLIDIKMEKGRVETRPASIMLVSVIRKITTLNVFLDFIQAEAVGEGISPASYRIYFITDDNEKISNELLFIADKKDNDAQQRMVRLHFSLKNQHYDKSGKYYLLAVDESNGLEIFRHEVSMDLAFANEFGF
jgi:uncharacterized protein (TIGR02687 family)